MSGESYIRQVLTADIEHNKELQKLIQLSGRRHDFGLGFICSAAGAFIVGPTSP
jgi:hypothetical protein